MLKIKEQLFEKAKKEQAEYHNEVQHLSKDKLFNRISEISGIAMSSLQKSEAEYQEQSQQIRNAAKEEKISMPLLYYQNRK